MPWTSKQPYPEEFRIEAVKQITGRGHRAADVSARIGVSQHSLHKWIKVYSTPAAERQAQVSQTKELRRLKAELLRVTEERDILVGAVYLPSNSGEERVYEGAQGAAQRAAHVQGHAGASQRALRL